MSAVMQLGPQVDAGNSAQPAPQDKGHRALDIVYSDHEYEGGAIDSYDKLHVRYATGRRADSAQITNLADARLVSVSADPASLTVDYQVSYTLNGGEPRSPESVSLTLNYRDGQYLIAAEA